MTDTFGGKPATTITEIIHDDLPDWAIEAMAEGRFFNTAIVLFDTTIKKLKAAEAERDELGEHRDELLVVIAEMKQAMSFDWDLFKSTQESLREHMMMLRKISELPRFAYDLKKGFGVAKLIEHPNGVWVEYDELIALINGQGDE